MKKLVLIIFCLSFLVGCKQDDQTSPRTFLIPEGYVGWVQVKYDQPTPTKVSMTKNKNEYKVNEDGVAKTSEQHIHEGWATNRYYYVNEKGERTSLIPGKMVHGPSSGRELAGETVEYFFVGSSKQFHKDEYIPNEFEID